MMDIYKIRIDNKLVTELNSLMLSYVSEGKRAAATRYHHPIDAHRTLLGEVMARIMICSRLQVANNLLIFGINDHKKPLLIEPKGYYFNISHSGNWVVCALGSQRVGIDVEQVKSMDLGIAENYFAKSEYEALLRVKEEERLLYFFKLWTLKESYIKAVGKGLAIPLDSFSVTIREGDDIRLVGGDQQA